MPGKARYSQRRHRGGKRARRAAAQFRKSAPAPVHASLPKTATIQPAPAKEISLPSKAPVKAPPGASIKITPVKELKLIGIIAGSMFLVLFILAFILK